MRTVNWRCRVAVAALVACAVVCGVAAPVACAADEGDTAAAAAQEETSHRWDLAMAIAVSIGLSCIGAGYAVARVGAAALGAASEKPELLTRGLLFVALAEGIAIYGLLVAVLLWIKL